MVRKCFLTMKEGTCASVVAISTGTPSPSTIFSKRPIELGLGIVVVNLVKQVCVITNVFSLKYYHFINEFTQWTIIVTKGKKIKFCFNFFPNSTIALWTLPPTCLVKICIIKFKLSIDIVPKNKEYRFNFFCLSFLG